jgi:metal-responsive CopG/Arc/MetJ family transcriptional regulator
MAGKKIIITLPEPILEKLNELVAEKSLTKSMILRMAFEKYLDDEKKGETNGQ